MPFNQGKAEFIGDGVVPAPETAVAPEQPGGAQTGAPEDSVPVDRLYEIAGAAGVVAAGRGQGGRDEFPVKINREKKCFSQKSDRHAITITPVPLYFNLLILFCGQGLT